MDSYSQDHISQQDEALYDSPLDSETLRHDLDVPALQENEVGANTNPPSSSEYRFTRSLVSYQYFDF
jgi:hypothetical protein